MDTAQPLAAAETDPNAQLQNAADAFKAFTSEEPVVRARDDAGRFASDAEEPEEVEEDAPEAELESDAEDEAEDGEEAAEPAQPRPTSWPEDKAQLWEALPADTQAYLAERDAEQLRAVNAKFQESANARKAAMDEQAQAQATREQLARTLDAVVTGITPVKPDPRNYGAGTGQYNREAYDFDLAEYESQANVLAQLTEQRDAVMREMAQEADANWESQREALETEFQPRFLADVPELTDPAKAEPLIRSMVDYAVANGIPAEQFAPENHKYVTSPELHILWKAWQYDNLKAAPPQAKPKQASPAVKPGVSSPRSAQKAAQRARISDRLAREGSVEAGAAMWKQLLK